VRDALVAFVALEHLAFLALEMFFWEKPLGLRVFGQSREDAAKSAVLAKNQGLYNGFLAAGLLYALAGGHGGDPRFFLWCVVAAGAYGTWSTKKASLFLVQGLPALVALAL
jgi:putative membrane protein